MSVLWKSSESLPSGYQDKLLEKIRNCFLFSNLLHQNCSVPFSRSVISDSVAPRAAAHQASLSITNSWSLLIQISQEIGQVVWYSHLLNFAQFVVMHTVKGFGTVNKAEVDVFLDHSCFFDDPVDVGSLIFGSSAFSKSSLNIWKFTIHVLLKPGLENFEYYFANVWDECSHVVVWTLFGTAFLWDWNENWPFPVLWPLMNFPNLLVD